MAHLPRRRAIIIGGSMAGLFAGHFLRRAGWQVDIFERASGALSARGAGIMTHQALRDAMARLGFETRTDFGIPVTTRVVLDASGGQVAVLPFPQIATSWTRVYALLAESFPAAHYHLGADLVAIDETAGSVTARFADGRTETADLLVGADGVRSTVRRHVFPDVEPQYAGYVAWRFLLPERDVGHAMDDPLASEFVFGLPPGEQIVGYPVAGAGHDLRLGQRSYNAVWYRPADAAAALPRLLTDATGKRHDLGIPPTAVAPAVIADMRRDAARLLAPWFRNVVDRTPQPFLQPIYDLTVPGMARGRIALVGDAAFVVRPHVGAGVVKAADDACALAEAVSSGAPDAGLAAFDTARTSVGVRMVAHARRLGSYLKYAFASEEERAAAALNGAPMTVLAQTADLGFLKA